MFLPSWHGFLITNPYSSLLTAYPNLFYKLGTIPANEIAYASPSFRIDQETPLPWASCNLHIVLVWNTAARLHLNKHNPTCLQKSSQALVTSLKQIGMSTTLLAIPFAMLGMLRQRLVSRNLRNFTQIKCKLPSPHTHTPSIQ